MGEVEEMQSVIDLRDSVLASRAALSGRLAVVIGAASAIGRAISVALVAAGARVCAVDGDLAGLRETVRLAGQASPILYLQCDLGSENDIDGVTDFIDRFDRPLEMLILAGSLNVAGTLESGVIADLDEQYLVNIRGPYLVTQQLLPLLRGGRGRVVFVTQADSGDESDLQHSVTVAGVQALAGGLRTAAHGTGIRVTNVSTHATPAVDSDELVTVDPEDVATAVIQALCLPERVELSQLEVRPVVAPAATA